MDPATTVRLLEPLSLREAVNKYLQSNLIWRAEDRDLVWSVRFVGSKLSLLANKSMTFGELTAEVAQTLASATSTNVNLLTPELIAKVMIVA